MRQQQEAGVQASITRFAKPPKAEAADTTAQRGNKRHSDSMLLKVLGNSKVSNSKAAQQQRRVATPALSNLVLLAVTASAPARTAQKARDAGRVLTDEVQSIMNKQQQLLKASTSTPRLPGARTAGSAASQSTANQPQSHSSTAVRDPPQHGQQTGLQACPLCGEQVPAHQLQQHVDAELAQLDLQETETAAAETVGTGMPTALWPAQEQQQQRQQQYNHLSGHANQQQQWPGQQQQQQQQVSAQWQEPVSQPSAKRPRPVQQQHQQKFAQQQPWQQQQQQQELAQQQPWQQQQYQQELVQQQPWQQQQPQQQSGAWHKRPLRQQRQHQHQQREQQLRQQHTLQEQQHRAQPWPPQQHQPKQHTSSKTHSARSSSSSRSGAAKRTGTAASGVSIPVKSLSAAPRRPVGPDGQPVTHIDGGFDHWGDSSLNYLDDSAIGIDGGLPSADAYWEGVGRCAVGPRTLR